MRGPRAEPKDTPQFSSWLQKKEERLIKSNNFRDIWCHETPKERTVSRTDNGKVEVEGWL